MTSSLSQNYVLNHVPYDVWRAIFNICVANSTQSINPEEAPLLLGQICSVWRKIAIGSPELWCNIKVRIDEECHGFPRKELLVLALERAGGSPLVLVLQGGKKKATSVFRPETADLVDILLSNVSRAVCLNLDIEVIRSVLLDHPHGPRRFIKFIDTGAPLLKKLSISGKRFSKSLYFFELAPGPAINPIIAKLWTPAPKLQRLDLRGYIHFQNLSMMDAFGACYEQLTILRMDSPIATNDFVAILSAANKLVECKVDQLVGEFPAETRLGNLAKLQFLTVLDMGGAGEDEDHEEISPPLTQVLECIQAPSLTSLHLRRDRGWSRSSFIIFLQNSSCTIRDLTLDIQDSDEDAKIECLSLLPALETLDMNSRNRLTLWTRRGRKI